MNTRAQLIGIRRSVAALTTVALALTLALPATSAAPSTKLISQSSSGSQTSSHSAWPDISRYGRSVVFESIGDYLGTDSNGNVDVYRRYVPAGQTDLVSLDRTGGLSNGHSFEPAISDSGRYVAFSSNATDLVSVRLSGIRQVFRRDLDAGNTVLVSKGAKGAADAVAHDADISATGRYVVFTSEAKNLTTKKVKYTQIYLRDLKTKKTVLISKNGKGVAGNSHSRQATVSADGRFVVFMSDATNLSSKNEFGKSQIFLRDRKRGTTILVSKHPKKGVAGKGLSDYPAISANGRYVVFQSQAENLIKWHKDDNGLRDVYGYDRVAKTMKRLSVDWKGRQLTGESGHPDISADGQVVVFWSSAPSVAKGTPSAGHKQVYRRGTSSGSVKLVSRTSAGQAGNGASWHPVISANGRYVAYKSAAINLLRRIDTNGIFDDIFRTGPF